MTKMSRARKIAEKRKFVESVIRFAQIVIEKYGTVSRNRARAQLLGFSHFSFVYEGGPLSPRGEQVIVWHHPQSDEAQISQQVLSVRWFDIKNPDVDLFVRSQKWQRAIKKLIKKEGREVRKRQAGTQKEQEDKKLRETCITLYS